MEGSELTCPQPPKRSSVKSQLRLDPLTGRWVVVSVERFDRPAAFTPRTLAVQADRGGPCPFCPGSEEATPPALETYGASGAWAVRVVPNLYPAFSGEEPMIVTTKGPVFSQAPASGIHEVLVLSPEHSAGWADLSADQTGLVMAAIRDRIDAHEHTPALRYSQAIVNAGREAGASIEHPHGQLLGMSFVPRELVDELAGFARFTGNCLLCTTIEAELDVGHRVVEVTDDAVAFCPFWSGVPFEMMVAPRSHAAHLHHRPMEELEAVGRAVQSALGLLRDQLGDIAYNLVFHSAPYRASGTYHWHVHIWPKLTTLAGFELGTGVFINIVAPEQAAQEFRARVRAA
ncbi:MAG: galactose-1-phosphate uridylyltransferase [Acidimicrobiales bacterium]